MTTVYCTPEELAAQVGIYDSDDDPLITAAIAAASRQVDSYCGRRFWQDETVVVREVYPSGTTCVDLLDQPGEAPASEISTVTGLIVKTDTGDDGTFATTLTISTDFLLLPRNAVAEGIAFSEIRTVGTGVFPRSSTGRATVQVTAKFGWPSVPANVSQATLVQATQLYKAKDAVFGAAALGEQGAMYVRAALNPIAKALLQQHQVVPVG